MATYILLMTLTPDGQVKAMIDPEFLLRVAADIDVPGASTMGCYAVLGSYDFVTIVEAEDNEQMAKFSLELGVKAGVHITTLPAVPVGQLDEEDEPLPAQSVEIGLPRPVGEERSTL